MKLKVMYQNKKHSFESEKLSDMDIENLRLFVTYQKTKILKRYHKSPIMPILSTVKLQQFLSQCYEALDLIQLLTHPN